ncbi:MAG: DUF262 domain-containing protein [Patescibacteria group bacterium]|nr:DUF262 domain-containing protein [Patescibacteria group bacterium]
MRLLIDDLTSTFLKSFRPEHKRSEVENYQNYYLGPVVFSERDGLKSIIDGQQRITSITLFLIFLNHLQRDFAEKVSISDLIYSEKYGEKSFNMIDENRRACLTALFETGEYSLQKEDDETVQNIVARYEDIDQVFPEEMKK